MDNIDRFLDRLGQITEEPVSDETGVYDGIATTIRDLRRRSLTEHGRPNNKLNVPLRGTIDYVQNGEVDANCMFLGDAHHIFVTSALMRNAALFCGSLFKKTELYHELFSRIMEQNDTTDRQLVYSNLSQYLFCNMTQFVLLHEAGHALLGHMLLVNREFDLMNISETEAPSSEALNSTQSFVYGRKRTIPKTWRRIFEYDADRFAACQLLEGIVGGCEIVRPRLNFSRNDRVFLMLTAIAGVLLILFQFRAALGKALSTYPGELLRVEHVLLTLSLYEDHLTKADIDDIRQMFVGQMLVHGNTEREEDLGFRRMWLPFPLLLTRQAPSIYLEDWQELEGDLANLKSALSETRYIDEVIVDWR
jgi:hypothetical protein